VGVPVSPPYLFGCGEDREYGHRGRGRGKKKEKKRKDREREKRKKIRK
jgi:hypothetical protein